ncbi:MAG: CYTH domain-containing protein [Clostridia bacterium]|nr:CYTH domain-containing protein [Clostridia bacterium]
MTELEKKLLLTEDEYDYLMEHLGYESPLIQKSISTQINYYFDTDDFSMNRQNTTCRIRLKNGKYQATMKKRSPGDDQSTETEMEIYSGLESNAFTDMGLKLQGELITKRCVVFKDANYEAVLDKNEYLDQTDYELEIEYTPDHEKDAQAILKIFRDMLTRRKCFLAYKESIGDLPNVASKSSRFFERMSSTKAIPQTPTFDPSRNYNTKLDYSDPDDYMRNYFDSVTPAESVCLSCGHFGGSSCHSPSGFCNYEHY